MSAADLSVGARSKVCWRWLGVAAFRPAVRHVLGASSCCSGAVLLHLGQLLVCRLLPVTIKDDTGGTWPAGKRQQPSAEHALMQAACRRAGSPALTPLLLPARRQPGWGTAQRLSQRRSTCSWGRLGRGPLALARTRCSCLAGRCDAGLGACSLAACASNTCSLNTWAGLSMLMQSAA